ncbi:hypothetical protein GCM10020367_62560 [Streptomyces sannanensis]|uniref:Uncharacterized protein n=1 Tax=Streptomyces sannanensis TaxID=285536 RepID=A0ABP6SKU5_9ACTN
MSAIIVVHEVDRPVPGLSPARPAAERPVRRVHAAPADAGDPSSPGPRTFCGKDTFAMEVAVWKPAEHPGSTWYPPEYADRVCDACALAMEN